MALLIGANPGPEEVKRGAPFVGAAGVELMKGLAAVGVRRRQVSLTNAILCAPPGPPRGALERFNHWLQKENKARAAVGIEEIPTPLECCLPRLQREVAYLPSVVTLGGTALHALTGRPQKIMEARGGPREVPFTAPSDPTPVAARVLPALHPSFVMSTRRWQGAFRADLGRAFRWFTSGLAWKDPRVVYIPSPMLLRIFLEEIRKDPFSVFDVETLPGFPEQDHFEPMLDKLRCFGIGVARGLACVVPFRSVEDPYRSFYTREEQPEIVQILRDYLTSPKWLKAGWNSRYYDRMVVEAQLGVIPKPHLDGIGLSRLAEPELPHNLGFAGSIYTDVNNWKAGHIATEAKTDRQLWDYNAKDTVVTAMAIPALAKVTEDRDQKHLLPFFAKRQDECVGLHQNGIYIDQEKRREWDKKLLWQAATHRRKIRELAKSDKLNPASFPQIADLLFGKLDIAPHHYTDLAEPSTDDDALRAFLSETWGLDAGRKAIVSAIRDFRRVTKRRGLVVRLRPITEAYYEEPFLIDLDETPEEREERERRLAKGKKTDRACGLCLPDGRIHPDWLAHGTVGWRFSSNSPNAQNWEDKLRDMAIAGPGHVFVGCDSAQVELRVVAGLSKCAYYIDAFREKADPHKTLCVDTFGERFSKADKDQQKKLRRSIKELTYSSLYWAENETKLEIVTSAEDENEQLIFPDFTLREVDAFTQNWFRRCPEIPAWWESILEEWKRQHYLAEPIMGLKCDFLDGEDRSKLVNYKPQAGGSGALTHLATDRAFERIPHQKWGPGTGLVQQGHDSTVFEVPVEHERYEGADAEFGYCPPGCRCIANETARYLEECFTFDGNQWGMDVPFFGESKIGHTWKSV
jgi:DNA polymerase I-like protein with 3'-5' exonuclease and polymerase domains/uracil-DNA glycosylase